MNPFDDVRFHGSFRDYQQRVLDHAQDFLEDGRIHIVAAPGSGKTVLGLELIRRLASPCLILSPTTAIRTQWGERFRDLFLDGPDRFESLFSYDLHQPRLITCITYQALYSAVEKKSAESEDDPDCSDVDLFAAVRAAGITTVCLDEAHHLKNEWQKALEKFLSALEGQIRLIALTAACPTVLGKKKEYAETLARQLKKNTGRFELIYTYREDGRRLIRKCWRHSYLTQNEKVMKRYRAFHV